jgi:hypothetical protein
LIVRRSRYDVLAGDGGKEEGDVVAGQICRSSVNAAGTEIERRVLPSSPSGPYPRTNASMAVCAVWIFCARVARLEVFWRAVSVPWSTACRGSTNHPGVRDIEALGGRAQAEGKLECDQRMNEEEEHGQRNAKRVKPCRPTRTDERIVVGCVQLYETPQEPYACGAGGSDGRATEALTVALAHRTH